MQTLSYFHTHSFLPALKAFFEDLNVPLHYISDLPARPEDILDDKYKSHDKAHTLIDEVYSLGMVDDAVFNHTSSLFPNKWTPEKLQKIAQKYEGLLIFGLTLKAQPTRSQLAEITRAFNRAFPYMPVILVFRYENYLTLAHTERTEYKQAWREGEKMGKVTLLKDINIENPHTGHIHILQKLAIQRAGKEAIYTFAQLYAYWQTVLNVATLNKLFYKELFDWYLLANKDNNIVFNTTEAKETPILIIKLITRIIFLWFLKERKLVSEKLFDLDFLQQNLRNFAENDSSYYKGILQNLFFNVLNQKIENRFLDGNEVAETLYFQDFEAVKTELNRAPFVNGGLFDATVAEIPHKSLQPEKLAIPNFLFFEGKRNQDFSSLIEGDKKATQVHVLGLIPLLEKYKFTIEENTPIEEEIALDPELLGKIFESLLAAYQDTAENTKISARKATGSFYTPREIVEYMVDESLMAFLKEKVQSAETAAKLPALLSYQSTDYAFDEAEQSAMIDALDNCKILDPACGSGAFPMGVLAKMTHILAKIDPENRLWFEKLIGKFPQPVRAEMRTKLKDENGSYLRKLGIILNSIYGVDIQPVAVQIAKLRCFISLIIDQKTNQNPADNYGVKALPNLEFKFVAANTLIDAPHFSGKNDPILQKLIGKFGEATENYFYAAAEKKESLKAEIKEIVNKITSYNHEIILQNRKKIAQESGTKTQKQGQKKASFNLEGNTEEPVFVAENEAIYEKKSTFREKNIENLAEAQSLWDSFQHIFQEKSVGFFNTSYFFPAVKEGFDIVIGNPPYIQIQKFAGKPEQRFWEKANYETYTRMGDIYSLFYEKGTDLLAPKGILCYITSNKWMRANYGQSTRQFFADKTHPLLLVDFGNVQVFETATVDTNILLLQKPIFAAKSTKPALKAARLEKDMNIKQGNLSQYVQKNSYTLATINHNPWIVGEKDIYDIKGQVEKQGIALENWEIEINYGIKTGFNEAFIIPKDIKDSLIAEDPKSAEIIQPILRGKDISAWYPNFAEQYLITTFPSLKLNIDDYPAVKKYLLSFGKDRLAQDGKGRKKSTNKWFETQDQINYWQDFQKPKIIYRDITQQLDFAYDKKVGFYGNNTIYMMTGANLAYLTCFFNSKLFKYCFWDNFTDLGGGARRLFKVFMDKIPVKPINEAEAQPFERMVAYLVELKQHVLTDMYDQMMPIYFEQVANALIYELYFPAEFAEAKLAIHVHLQDLPVLQEDGNKLLQLRKIYVGIHQEYHPLTQALFSMLAIPKMHIINNTL